METPQNSIEKEKYNAAKHAVELIDSNAIIGLGTGSTTKYLIDFLGEKIKNQQLINICAVASSEQSQQQAEQLGIQMLDINSIDRIDITIDGADEFDSQLNLMKGGGGALLREKIIAYHSNEVVIITDSKKKVEKLGQFPLPIEVMPITIHPVINRLKTLHLQPKIRTTENNKPFITDNKNYIVDLNLKQIEDVHALDKVLKSIPGIIENGLFIGYARKVIMGINDAVKIFERASIE